MLTKDVKEFLEKNIELIEENKFDDLYIAAEEEIYFSEHISNLTEVLLTAGIDPMEELTEVPPSYLYMNDTIKEIVIPDRIEFINIGAFFNCTALEKVTIGKGCYRIYNEAFHHCDKLKEVVFSEGLYEICDYAFRNCALEVITIPSSVEHISISAFDKNVVMRVVPGSHAHSWAVEHGYFVELIY